jgi:hypothetical protein
MNWTKANVLKHKKSSHRTQTFLILFPSLFLVLSTGCITVQFEKNTVEKVELGSETQVSAEDPILSSQSPQFTETIDSPIATSVVPDGILKFSDEFSGVSYGWDSYGNVVVKDDQIEIEERPSGGSGILQSSVISEGMGFLVLLKCTQGGWNVVLTDQRVNGKNYVGLLTDPWFNLITSVGKEEKFIGGQPLDGNLLMTPDRWYLVLIRNMSHGAFYIRIWEKENPDSFREAGVRLEDVQEGQSWYPFINVTTGKVTIDFYQELEFR